MMLTGNACQCPTCKQVFQSETGFNRHRVGEHPRWRCLSVAEMLQRGMSRNNAGRWIAMRMPVVIESAFRAMHDNG